MGRFKKGNKIELNRRELLKGAAGAAAGFGKLAPLAHAIFDGIFQNAYAQALGSKKKYLFVQQYGAPPRWFFDLPLTPDGDRSKFIASPDIGTRYTGGVRYTAVEYATSLVNGVHMPWLWRFQIPTSSGNWVPMGNLMEGMMMVRGASPETSSHSNAEALHNKPLGSSYTLNALAADLGNYPIAGFKLGGQMVFGSRRKLSAMNIPYGSNMLDQIMQPFTMPRLDQYESDQQKILTALQSSQASLDGLANSLHPGAEAIKVSTQNAVDLMKKDFGNLNTLYNSTASRYHNLILQAIDPSRELEGINDRPVGVAESQRGKAYQYGDGDIVRGADLRTMISPMGTGAPTTAYTLAGNFAVAEFMLLNNISSSVSISAPGLTNVSSGGGNQTQFFDEHSGGTMASLMINTYYNIALATCLYELVSKLKAAGMWNDTLIDLGGEFGRYPNGDGGGSEHSANSISNVLMSGSIGGFHAIGNIARQAPQGSVPGTWGYYAANDGFGTLNVGHYGASVAMILGAESPVTAVGPFMKKEGNKFVPILPMGKII